MIAAVIQWHSGLSLQVIGGTARLPHYWADDFLIRPPRTKRYAPHQKNASGPFPPRTCRWARRTTVRRKCLKMTTYSNTGRLCSSPLCLKTRGWYTRLVLRARPDPSTPHKTETSTPHKPHKHTIYIDVQQEWSGGCAFFRWFSEAYARLIRMRIEGWVASTAARGSQL